MGIKEFTKLISPEGEDRLRVKIKIEKGKVIDLVVQYEARVGGKWREVVRI